MKDLQPLFIIPARGGSKGIPHKNIKLLAGRPLIAYTIESAKEALSRINASRETAGMPLLDARRIILSTDDDLIAATAESEGLPVPYRRPAELATDTAGSREVIIDVMDRADESGIAYNCIILLQPTSPLRNADDIIGCLNEFDLETTDMTVSVREASSNPYYNCFETDPSTGYLHISKGDGLLTRRQDAPKAWEYNGAVYVINPDSIRKMPLGAFPRRIPFEMPAERSFDIDTLIDWTVAETIIQSKTLKQ